MTLDHLREIALIQISQAQRTNAMTTASSDAVWTNAAGTVRIYDESVSKAPVALHDAARPFVVMYAERQGYKTGGITWRLAGRHETMKQAKRHAYRAL